VRPVSAGLDERKPGVALARKNSVEAERGATIREEILFAR